MGREVYGPIASDRRGWGERGVEEEGRRGLSVGRVVQGPMMGNAIVYL